MDMELKKKWVEALRSGEYSQTDGELWADERANYGGDPKPAGYCCLGVLCDVVGYDKVGKTNYKIPLDISMLPDGDLYDVMQMDNVQRGPYIEDGKLYIDIHGEFPEFLAKQWGFDKKVQYNGERRTLQYKLVDMNDAGKSFEQIANYIEKVNI